MDNLNQLETWLDPLLERLKPSEKKRLINTLKTGLRKRQAERIRRQQNPDGTPYTPRRPRIRDRGRNVRRRGEMFRKLRTARHLKATASADDISVGFSGPVAKIVEIHQEGLAAPVSKNGPLYQYPARRLLGFSADDIEFINSTISENLNL